MKKTNLIFIATTIFIMGVVSACAEPGEEGSGALDCGEFGSEHDGHCHCVDGHAFYNETCVSFSAITELCEDHDGEDTLHQEESIGVDTAEHEYEHEDEQAHEDAHEHASTCLCHDAAQCVCDGTLTFLGGNTYCEPPLHE